MKLYKLKNFSFKKNNIRFINNNLYKQFSIQNQNDQDKNNQKENYKQQKEQDEYEDKDDFFEEQNEKNTRKTQAEQENPRVQEKKQNKTKFRKFNRFFWYSSYILIGINIYLIYTDDKNNLISFYPYNSVAQYLVQKYNDTLDFITKPPSNKLLPDQIYIQGFTREPLKTLVLDLTGTIISHNYEMGRGLLIVKRPGLAQFLKKLVTKYEIIIFANEDLGFVSSVSEKLDPYQQIFLAKLGNESLVLESSGKYKDLKYLNRDLNKVIVIDKSLHYLKYNQENCIIVDKFEGDQNDNKLFELLPLLEHLSSPNVKDIRVELKKYGNQNPEKKYLEEIQQKKEYLQKQRGGFFGGFSNQNKQFKKV